MPRVSLATPVLWTVLALTALGAGLVSSLGPATARATASPQEPTPDAPARLSFDDLFDEERTGRRPTQTAWHPDGGALTYVWDDGDGEALWRMEAATGETTRLLEVAELAPPARDGRTESGLAEQDGGEEGGDRSGETLDAYHWSPAGDALLLESGGDLWLLRPGAEDERRLARLTTTEAAEEDPAISPDGRKVAYVREADLYLLELPEAGEGEAQHPSGASGAAPEAAGAGTPSPPAERALTADGEPGTTLNGTTSWVYWEEIWSRDATGFWWSPDSTRIAYYRFDETPVSEYTLLPDYRPEYPEPEHQRYPKAGTTNPEVRLGILELATGETTWLDTDAPEEESYLARLHWTPDGSRVAVERLNREQDRLDLLLCDPASGACDTALTDGHPTWVNLGKETTFLPDGRLLWASERTGWRHLYLYSAPEDGLELLGALTSGPWAVTSVELAEDGQVFAAAHGTGTLGAARRRLLRIRFGDGASLEPDVQELAGGGADARGWHSARVAPGGGHLLH
ncbi:MAG: DPP IV N-terminal domain-containing protein, partial [Thermoanaerobaculia bacterium]